MAGSGALGANPVACLCHRRAASLRAPAPAPSARSSSSSLFRQDRRRGHAAGPRRGLLTTFVAAVEDAPAETAPSTSGAQQQGQEEDEFAGAIDFTNTDELYKRFNELLEQHSREIRLNDKVIGLVASVDARGAYIDMGGKQPLFCPVQEASVCKLQKATQVFQVDQQREFVVNHVDRKTGELRLSVKVLEKQLLWQRLRQICEEGAMVDAVVESTRPAGLIVKVGNAISGFVPGSHAQQSFGQNESWEDLVGTTMQLKVLELDEERDRLVLSNRKNTITSRKMEHNVGDVLEGTVASLQPYGAFVALGDNLNGLLHISQISHDRVSSVESVLQLGQKLKVMVLTLDKEKGRMSLSTKKLEPTPGDMLRDPGLVYRRADEMAAAFREQYMKAEAEARTHTRRS